MLVTEVALATEMSVKALIGVVLDHGTGWETRGRTSGEIPTRNGCLWRAGAQRQCTV